MEKYIKTSKIKEDIVVLHEDIFRYLRGLITYSRESRQLDERFIKDLQIYIDKQEDKYLKMLNKQEDNDLETILDVIGSHAKAEWYNHIFKYKAKELDLVPTNEDDDVENSTKEEDEDVEN